MDVWFIDDNCLATPPAIFDEAMRALDVALEARGVTRGTGDDVKSVARIVCREDEVEAWSRDGEWATEYVRKSCIVKPPNTPAEY